MRHCVWGTVVLLLLLEVGAARAGDPDTANKLCDKGEQASRAHEYKVAEQDFEKALAEHRPLPKAALGLGRALEKLKKPRQALKAYLDCEDQVAGMKSPKAAELQIFDKAKSAVSRLDERYARLADIDKAFESRCMAFGRRYLHSNPTQALRAFQDVVAIDPENDLARIEASRLADSASSQAYTKGYVSLVKSDELPGWDPGVTKEWKCAGGVITANSLGMPGDTNNTNATFNGTYSVRFQMKIEQTNGEYATAGIFLALAKEEKHYFVTLLPHGENLRVGRIRAGNDYVFQNKILNGFKDWKWHTIELDVSPGSLVCKLDGRKMLQVDGLPKDAFDGPLGLYAQEVEVEYKGVEVKR